VVVLTERGEAVIIYGAEPLPRPGFMINIYREDGHKRDRDWRIMADPELSDSDDDKELI